MITREEAREIAAKHGIGEAPADHPIYSEPPSIRFTSPSKKSTTTTDTSSEQETQPLDPHSQRLAMLDAEMLRRMNVGMGLDSEPEKTEE